MIVLHQPRKLCHMFDTGIWQTTTFKTLHTILYYIYTIQFQHHTYPVVGLHGGSLNTSLVQDIIDSRSFSLFNSWQNTIQRYFLICDRDVEWRKVIQKFLAKANSGKTLLSPRRSGRLGVANVVIYLHQIYNTANVANVA